MKESKDGLAKSKTIWSAILTGLVFLSSPEVIGILPEKPAKIAMTIGTILTIWGLRSKMERM